MPEFVSSALFVYTSESSDVVDTLQENSHGVDITVLACDELLRDPGRVLRDISHVVVSGGMIEIKAVLGLAREHKFSVGIVPLPSQRDLVRAYALPARTTDAIELALQKDAQAIDLVLCNDQIMLHRAVVGRLPLLDSTRETGRFGMIVQAVKKLSGLSLLDFTFSSGDDRQVKTAACGCMVMQHQAGSLAARSLAQYSSVHDGMATLIIS